MSGCPSCQYPVDIEWSTCRRCGASLPAVLEVGRITVPASLPRRPAPVVRKAPAPGVRTTTVPAPSDNLLPHAAPGEPGADTLLPKPAPVAQARTAAKHAGLAAVAVTVGYAVRRLVRHAR